MRITDAKTATEFLRAWNGHPGRDTYVRLAVEGMETVAALTRTGESLQSVDSALRTLRDAINNPSAGVVIGAGGSDR